jgi:hypothetical protein
MILPWDRAPYSAMVDRPPMRLPGGARIVGVLFMNGAAILDWYRGETGSVS